MLPIAYCWAPGHQMRVLISSANYTKYQANPNLPLNDGEFFRATRVMDKPIFSRERNDTEG